MSRKPKKQVLTKAFITVFFIVLLILPAIIRQDSISRPSKDISMDNALKFFGFYLEDVTVNAGFDFQHQSPELDPKLDHIYPQIASMGASVSICDFDGDGWQDIYVTTSRQGASNALFHNQQDGSFLDVAQEKGLARLNSHETGVSMGSVWADIDNDGFEDLLVYKWGRPELYRNLGGKVFENITEKAGLPAWVNANTAIWFDFDRDGFTDLFIGGYYREDINLWDLQSTVIMPESFEYANNGGRNYLLRNNGDGTFRDITEEAGLTGNRWTLAAGSLDLNGDGYQDLALANDYGVDELFINMNGQYFRETGKQSGIGYSPKSGMNMSFGDVENDGRQSLYISNITEVGVLLQGNNLWLPDFSDDVPSYKNVARQRGVELGGWSYCAQFGDLNNDGALDLYVANGFISGLKGSSYWYDYSKVTGGNKAIISDAANWPAMEGKSQSGYQHNMIWLNDGKGNFLDASREVCAEALFDSRAVALADLWNRGVLDVVVANLNDRLLVYRNTADPANNWIAFDLEGSASNRSAIGAIVSLSWNGKKQVKSVDGGIGFSAQNQRIIHFGIGKNTEIEKVEIIWPSGIRNVITGPGINKVHKLKESAEAL